MGGGPGLWDVCYVWMLIAVTVVIGICDACSCMLQRPSVESSSPLLNLISSMRKVILVDEYSLCSNWQMDMGLHSAIFST